MRAPIDILLVDDEPRNLDALEAILTDPGYRLLRALDADVALRLLLENDVAAIVLDIKMPGVSGFDLAKMIKNTKRFRETPIVFLTAYLIDDQDVIAGYGAGAVDYLTKPINPQILRHKIAVLADLFRKTRDLAELNEKLEERVKERTADLQKSEAALRLAAAQKDEFLAVLAHELRNPLAPLRMGLDILLRQLTDEPRVQRTLASMNRQLDHMVRLIDDLLDISRISRGILELKKEPLDVAAAVQFAIENAQPFFQRRGQNLVTELATGFVADADPTRLVQIVANLLHNASKFTAEGGTITIQLGGASGSAVIRVTDNGIGLPTNQLERVFDMFARVERPGASNESGLGIGLALARRLAQLHGGMLTASSKGEGHGSTFTLSLPTVNVPADAKVTTNGAAAGPAHTLKVLVIEDNDDAAETLGSWLEDFGHEVSIARTGRRGIELVKEKQPDLVFCDLGLPEMDGLDVCRGVRALMLAAQPVMVALTGWGRPDDLRRTRDAGFDHHVVKPVAPDRLHAILRGMNSAGP
ncbi:MAG TPA: response regulator [Polyangia bacterium]|jgi:signal transduction histidine kinase|nr:response regulator [Polyangia bacterium]